ncbi:MAG: hypothetical protein KDF64_13505 [Geminicoccaceae bacterium]|nr:hypothetical protein [Geminicoccaceae bacterium]
MDGLILVSPANTSDIFYLIDDRGGVVGSLGAVVDDGDGAAVVSVGAASPYGPSGGIIDDADVFYFLDQLGGPVGSLGGVVDDGDAGLSIVFGTLGFVLDSEADAGLTAVRLSDEDVATLQSLVDSGSFKVFDDLGGLVGSQGGIIPDDSIA